MAWKGTPASGTRRASMPERLPIQCTSTWAERSAAATASPALVCPPVPPPAMTILTWERERNPRHRRGRGQGEGDSLALLEGQVDEPGDELGVWNARGFPETRVGAGGGEARDGIDLVDQHALALDEEVHARHAGAVDCPEGAEGEIAHGLGHLGRQRRGHLEGSLPRRVLRLVVVPLARIADFARHRSHGCFIAE